MFTIETGIPIPPTRQFSTLYPFRSMEVGESFVVEFARKQAAFNKARYHKKTHPGWNYRAHRLPDGSCRFWRIA